MAASSSFYKGRWWYSACEIEQGHATPTAKRFKEPPVTMLQPTAPLHEYDPFRFYYPPGSASKGTQSLPFLFANLNPDNQEELVAFCRRFGMPGPFSSFETWEQWGFQPYDVSNPAVRDRLRKAKPDHLYAIQQELIEMAKPVDPSLIDGMALSVVAQEVYRFKNLLLLAEHRTAPRNTSTWIMEPDFPHLLRGWFRPIPSTASEASTLLEKMLARGCSQLRMRFVHDVQLAAWTLRWESLSLTSLMYLMVGIDLQGSGHIRTCPACARLFLASRPGKSYCSPECQNRFHAREYYRAQRHRTDKPQSSANTAKKKGG